MEIIGSRIQIFPKHHHKTMLYCGHKHGERLHMGNTELGRGKEEVTKRQLRG